MKYVVILTDGMADYKIEELGLKTPLGYANIPNIDKLSREGMLGLVKTIPDGMKPGSDVANLSVMGYAPSIYHTGRSPLEAASIGVKLKNTDVTFRCNLVTLCKEDGQDYSQCKITDHSAGEITTEESCSIIEDLKKVFDSETMKFYKGVSYRHLIVWDKGPYEFELTPPHDILGRNIGEYLPKGKGSEILLDMMEKSFELLKNHPVNIDRRRRGLNPANSIWIWGEGKKPSLNSFEEKFGIKGSVISAVDLIKGIGILAGLNSIDVEGATGNIHTNFKGKADAAIKELKKGMDFVYVHLEAPDECGHQGDIKGKIKSIELIDSIIVKEIWDYLKNSGEDYRIMVLPDHPTPISIRTHTAEPVPFLIYDSKHPVKCGANFDEESAQNSGVYIDEGCKLLPELFSK